jgi:phospholipase A1
MRFYRLLALVLFTAWTSAYAAAPHQLTDCVAIEDAAARLRCYDQLAGRTVPKDSQAQEIQAEIEPPLPVPEPSLAKPEVPKTEPQLPALSALDRRWKLEKAARRSSFAITPYKPNYVLPITYVSSLNKEVYQGSDRDLIDDKVEAKFQISLRVKLWEGIFGDIGDLWFAYTQLAFWQIYSSHFSAPFRETNYEPELMLGVATDFPFLGLRGRYLTLGFNHQSNGRSEPLSRSWNRITAGALFERGNLALLTRGWWRLPEDKEDDDNPDIEDYIGRGEVWGFYKRDQQTFALMLRNNFDHDENRGAVELDWSFPLFGPVKGYFQYFYGYGESLIDYNHKHQRAGLGFLITNWL